MPLEIISVNRQIREGFRWQIEASGNDVLKTLKMTIMSPGHDLAPPIIKYATMSKNLANFNFKLEELKTSYPGYIPSQEAILKLLIEVEVKVDGTVTYEPTDWIPEELLVDPEYIQPKNVEITSVQNSNKECAITFVFNNNYNETYPLTSIKWYLQTDNVQVIETRTMASGLVRHITGNEFESTIIIRNLENETDFLENDTIYEFNIQLKNDLTSDYGYQSVCVELKPHKSVQSLSNLSASTINISSGLGTQFFDQEKVKFSLTYNDLMVGNFHEAAAAAAAPGTTGLANMKLRIGKSEVIKNNFNSYNISNTLQLEALFVEMPITYDQLAEITNGVGIVLTKDVDVREWGDVDVGINASAQVLYTDTDTDGVDLSSNNVITNVIDSNTVYIQRTFDSVGTVSVDIDSGNQNFYTNGMYNTVADVSGLSILYEVTYNADKVFSNSVDLGYRGILDEQVYTCEYSDISETSSNNKIELRVIVNDRNNNAITYIYTPLVFELNKLKRPEQDVVVLSKTVSGNDHILNYKLESIGNDNGYAGPTLQYQLLESDNLTQIGVSTSIDRTNFNLKSLDTTLLTMDANYRLKITKTSNLEQSIVDKYDNIFNSGGDRVALLQQTSTNYFTHSYYYKGHPSITDIKINIVSGHKSVVISGKTHGTEFIDTKAATLIVVANIGLRSFELGTYQGPIDSNIHQLPASAVTLTDIIPNNDNKTFKFVFNTGLDNITSEVSCIGIIDVLNSHSAISLLHFPHLPPY